MLDRLFWVGSLTLFAGFIMVLIAHGAIPDLQAEAQTDTRHASLPPNAEQVLVWKSGPFNLGCISDIAENDILFVFYRDVEHFYSTQYFWDAKDTTGTTEGAFKKSGSNHPSARFHILDSGINGSSWYTYGVAYGSICPDASPIFDFKVAGNCDGSTITVETSDYRINMTQIVKPHAAINYHVWCGFIPDAPVGTLNNKIF